ncbi:TPA: hypothetical protein ACQZB3_000537 [Escherichia coli]
MQTLQLSNEDLVNLDRAIQELPMKIALPLINKINEQLKQQQEGSEPLQGEANE